MKEAALLAAPFQTPLEVKSLNSFSEDEEIVLQQLGIVPSERIEKLRSAPLGDPISVRIGGTTITLRKDVCEKIAVSWEGN